MHLKGIDQFDSRRSSPRSKAFACGMRESYEPDIIIEDFSPFHRLLVSLLTNSS